MAMAKYDLTPRIAPNLDLHLVFPLLEFTQERELYPNDQILKAKIELLNNTNVVDYAMDIHKSLHYTDDVPQGFWRHPGLMPPISLAPIWLIRLTQSFRHVEFIC
ncbi:putative eukaryotic translation initiation factor 3 subunit E [Helianthus debilis subsp. tardiflorus]